MNSVYAINDHLITSLGNDSEAVWQAMKAGQTGIALHDRPDLSPEAFWASLIDDIHLNSCFADTGIEGEYTRFEKLCLMSATHALQRSDIDPSSKDTIFILSTTKGNIDLLEKKKKENFDPERLYIWHTANLICRHFKNSNKPIIISNACISGVLAMVTAYDYLSSGKYKHAVVIGADIASEFVISGFQSFKSLASGPCKPFDLDRDGLNLGEAAACLILSTDESRVMDTIKIRILGGGTGNDANHISGPSRTGEGLYTAVQHALSVAGLSPEEIDFISAHGTATPFNDEMESKAFSWAGMSNVWLNSMKGYFGHSLGAAGLTESIVSIWSMKKNLLLRTLGFQTYGVPEPIKILDNNIETQTRNCLKTASGFGGCNGAVIIHKENQ